MEPWLERAAALRPGAVAIEADDGSLTYAELLARARAGAAELGATPGPDGRELLHARSSLVVDSVAAGLGGPIDGPCTAIGDEQALRAETAAAKALGFVAKACIHPAQLAIVHEVLAPSAEELDWARRVVAAAEQAQAEGRGAVALDGTMVDLPVVERARKVLAERRNR